MEQYFAAPTEPSVMARFLNLNRHGEDCLFISIRVGGTKEETTRRPTPKDFARFSTAWAAYKGEETVATGTPLTQLPGINDARCAAFRVMGVETVEQLAALHDGAVAGLGVGAMELRKLAKRFVENSFVDTQGQHTDKIDELESKIAELERMLDMKPDEDPKPSKKSLEKRDAAAAEARARIMRCAKVGCNRKVKVQGALCWQHVGSDVGDVEAPLTQISESGEPPEGHLHAPDILKFPS